MSRVNIEGEQLVVEELTQDEIDNAEDFQYESDLELPEDQEVTVGGN